MIVLAEEKNFDQRSFAGEIWVVGLQGKWAGIVVAEGCYQLEVVVVVVDVDLSYQTKN